MYDPALGRWTQPDTVVPVGVQGVQAWDRYAYVNNNPGKYVDKNGHWIVIPAVLVGAVVGGAIARGVNAYQQHLATGSIDGKQVVSAAAGGAVSGAILTLAPATLLGAALIGGAASVAGAQVSSAVDATLSPTGNGFLNDYSANGGITNGSTITNVDKMVVDFAAGAALNYAYAGATHHLSKHLTIVQNPLQPVKPNYNAAMLDTFTMTRNPISKYTYLDLQLSGQKSAAVAFIPVAQKVVKYGADIALEWASQWVGNTYREIREMY